jgi:copper ion binding protein
MTEQLKLHVTGMTCGGCENAIRLTLLQLAGVQQVKASREKESVEVSYDGEKISHDKITRAIEDLGYQVAA